LTWHSNFIQVEQPGPDDGDKFLQEHAVIYNNVFFRKPMKPSQAEVNTAWLNIGTVTKDAASAEVEPPPRAYPEMVFEFRE
jgi:hypothetical protein